MIRAPGLAAALVLTIALGLGSNVTVLGFIRGLTTRKAAAAGTGRVTSLFGRDAYRGAGPVSYDDFVALKGQVRGAKWMGAARVSQGVMKFEDQTEIVTVAEVTPEVARLFGLSTDGGAVMGRRFWRGQLSGKKEIAGEAVRVAPEGLEGVYEDRVIDVWRVLDENRLTARDRAARNVWVLAEFGAGVSAAEMESIVALPYSGMAPDMAAGLARVGMLLRVAAGFVFFIACVNVAAFLLGRATLRAHETSIRIALGVSRGLLARALLADGVAIAAAGGAVSLVLARWTAQVIPSLLFEQDAQFLVLAPSWASVAAACAAGAAMVVVCGFLPWLEIRRERPAEVLGRQNAGPARAARIARSSLVTAQMACCCVLTIGTGYLYAGLHASMGMGGAQRLGQTILATAQAHRAASVDTNYFRIVAESARRLPGVTRLAWAARLPGSDASWREYRIEPRGLPVRQVRMDVAGFTTQSAALFRWPPKAGRMFGYRDGGCRVAVVNEEAAAELFGEGTAGRMVKDAAGEPVKVVGVMERQRGAARARPTIYFDETHRLGAAVNAMAAGFSAARSSELERAELDTNVVSASYFHDMGFGVVAGQVFSDDAKARGCRAAVVNQEAADLFFGGSAVGAAIIDDLGERTEITGVVHAAVLGVFSRRTEPAVYLPMAQDCLSTMVMILGTREAGGPTVEDVRQAVRAVPGQGPAPVVVKTLETYLRETALAPLHIATAIVGACAALALFLGVLGLYGALNDAARARRRDVALRIAMGARRRHVVGQVLREGGRLAGVGSAVGFVASLAAAQVLPRITWGVGAPAWWVWIAGPAVLAVAVAAASLLPARRSLMVDPVRLLREE